MIRSQADITRADFRTRAALKTRALFPLPVYTYTGEASYNVAVAGSQIVSVTVAQDSTVSWWRDNGDGVYVELQAAEAVLAGGVSDVSVTSASAESFNVQAVITSDGGVVTTDPISFTFA